MKRWRGSSPPVRLSSLSPALLLLCAACATVTEDDPPSNPSASAAGAAGAPAGVGGGANGGTGNVGLGGSSSNGSGGASSPGSGGRPLAGGAGGGASAGAGGASAGAGGTPPVVDTMPQFPSGMLLLEDDFENFVQANWLANDGQWAITTDPEAEGNVYGQTETNASSPHMVTAGDTSWRGVVAEVDFNVVSFNGSSSSYMAGLCLRVQDADNFYMVGLRSNTGGIQLRGIGVDGGNLAQSEYEEGVEGVWYHLKVEAVGSTITAYLDDVLMFTYPDATIQSGGIGLCTVRASALFDNVRVAAP